ncbi:DUF4124 domain-containing protein [Thermodesulfobacteriota bacterium]
MRWRYLLLMLLMVWFASPVHAEFYRYKDENGVTRFTDNIVDVPMDQRKGVHKYETAAPPGEPKQLPAAAPAPKPDETSIEIPPGADADRLTKIKAELDKEHVELLMTKSALDKETDIYSSNEKFEVYKAKVTQFNLRKEAYEKRVEAFKRELEAYSKPETQAPQAPAAEAGGVEAEETEAPEAEAIEEEAEETEAPEAEAIEEEAEETEAPEAEAIEEEAEETEAPEAEAIEEEAGEPEA